MSFEIRRKGTECPRTTNIESLDSSNLLLPPSCDSQSSIPCDSATNSIDNEVAVKEVSGCHVPPINVSVPLLGECHRNNQRSDDYNVNLEMTTGSQSDNSTSFIKCVGSTDAQKEFTKANTSCNSVCGPNPKKMIRWLFIFVFHEQILH